MSPPTRPPPHRGKTVDVADVTRSRRQADFQKEIDAQHMAAQAEIRRGAFSTPLSEPNAQEHDIRPPQEGEAAHRSRKGNGQQQDRPRRVEDATDRRTRASTRHASPISPPSALERSRRLTVRCHGRGGASCSKGGRPWTLGRPLLITGTAVLNEGESQHWAPMPASG